MAQFDLDKFTAINFEKAALQLFLEQYNGNAVYKAYADAIGTRPAEVDKIETIPFLPVSFFKTHRVQTHHFDPAIIFESSGTTGSSTSRHYLKDTSTYESSFLKCFEIFYGSLTKYCILGLLPSYLERSGSSLVFMVDRLVKESANPLSGFYLDEFESLYQTLLELERAKQPAILIGVSFALLDFSEKYKLPLNYTIVMETGGMKGRRKEMTREELHEILKSRFSISQVHSEYGMTELLSQAYSKGNGRFYCPPWMKVMLRSEDDPLSVLDLPFEVSAPVNGLINIIDLANVDSCSFIATDDVGKLYKDGSFEVTGRLDNSDIRGCSLLIME